MNSLSAGKYGSVVALKLIRFSVRKSKKKKIKKIEEKWLEYIRIQKALTSVKFSNLIIIFHFCSFRSKLDCYSK